MLFELASFGICSRQLKIPYLELLLMIHIYIYTYIHTFCSGSSSENF